MLHPSCLHRSHAQFSQGTLPFVAIKMIQNMDENVAKKETLHAAEHDLESVYWLLIWMILRHTDHGPKEGDMACSNLFDTTRIGSKVVWCYRRQFTQSGPLFRLAEDLAQQVYDQNPPGRAKIPAMQLTHAKVLETFETHLRADDWRPPALTRPLLPRMAREKPRECG
jgi:hypothetical protein